MIYVDGAEEGTAASLKSENFLTVFYGENQYMLLRKLHINLNRLKISGGTIGMKKNWEGKLEPVPGYLETRMRQIPFLNGAVSLPLFP